VLHRPTTSEGGASLAPPRSCEDIAAFVRDQAHIMALLRGVTALGIADCWVGAGLIRNAVWDYLHGFPAEPRAESDVDVVYYDDREATLERDLAIERRLLEKLPDIAWSVHNQARMHDRNGDAPYRDIEDAIRRWPETATAIAARIFAGDVQLIAPHGIDDLVGMIVRPTPAFSCKLPIYRSRLATRAWARRWPMLRFIDA